MAAPERILYQFPLSHFCEKARWCLDHKELPFEAHNLMPGLHRLHTRLRAHSNTLPMLKDGERWVADSTGIALYLDDRYAELPLLPRDSSRREQVLNIDRQAGQLASDVRRWLYIHMADHPMIRRVMLGEGNWLKRTEKVSWPIVLKGVKKLYGIRPERAPSTHARIQSAIDTLEATLLAHGGRYLVGEKITLADIATASALAPMLNIADTPWVLAPDEVAPDAVQQAQQQLLDRPLGQYVLRLYQTDRNARVDWHGQ